MLTGKRAFEGEDVSDVLASVLAREPDWTLLPRGLSPTLGQLPQAVSPQGSRNSAVPDIATMRLALEGAFDTGASQRAGAVAAAQPTWRRLLPFVAGAVVAAVVAGVTVWSLWPISEPRTVTRFDYRLPESQAMSGVGGIVQLLTVSPDGRRVVYATSQGFYVRTMGELDAKPLPGTERSGASATTRSSRPTENRLRISRVPRCVVSRLAGAHRW